MYWRVLRHVVRRPAFPHLRSWCQGRNYSTSPSEKESEPLRILFCGSDDFSSASLVALFEEHTRNRALIASIEVLCRPGKPSGRNLKHIREVPIKAVAQKLGLPIHERDTFTGWDLPNLYPEPINLIIAVSFGLFVPPRILNNVEYGGLNVHPSILPDFRGPAPLHHTIMSGSKITGVTLQTLDPKSFDNGTILAQTPRNGLQLPFDGKCTYAQLLNFITPVAAATLVQGLRDRVFVPPHIDVGWLKDKKPENLTHATKITSDDRWIHWRDQAARGIERRHRALGRLWSTVYVDADTKKRVIFEDMEAVPAPEPYQLWQQRHKGRATGPLKATEEEKAALRFVVMEDREYIKPRYYIEDGTAVIIACTGGGIRVREITVEGKGKQDAATVMRGFGCWQTWNIRKIDGHVNVIPRGVRFYKGWPWKDDRRITIGSNQAADEATEDNGRLPHTRLRDG